LPIKTIYAGKLAKGILENKFREHKDLKQFTFQSIEDDLVIKSKHFTIDFFRVSHSVPDAFGVCFQTPNGIIVTTGDFRFDFQSPAGDQSDIHKMAEIGKRGVDILLCESTNSTQGGFNISEKYIFEELERIISNAKGRVFLTTFATQLDRIAELIKIAHKHGRKTVLGGRSMINNVEIYRNLGLLPFKQDNFLELRDMQGYKDDELFITVTGSQGQELSALGQMANGTHN
jgi:ribonuclease J